MQDLLNNFHSCFLNAYLLTPFIFAFIIGTFVFIKNPVYIKRLSNVFFAICLVLSFMVFAVGNNINAKLFNINFIYSGYSLVFSFLLTLLMFLICLFTKTFVFKMQRIFRMSLFLIYGILNLILMTDSIFCVFSCIVWLLYIFYFLSVSYANNEKDKKNVFYQLVFDIAIILCSIFLIGFDFARYYIINNIAFNFSSLTENFYHIRDISVDFAFFGFLLLIFRFFNFIPLVGKNIAIANRINPIIYTLISVCSLIAGGFLTIKTYSVFAESFYDYQEYIALFFVLNFVYFIILSVSNDSLIKFSACIIPAFNIVSLFNLFSFKENGLIIYIYSLLVNIVSYCFLNFAMIILSQKNCTDNLDEFKKLNPKNKILSFFVILSVLNIACIPFLSTFSSRFLSFVNIFSIDFDGFIMNLFPIILVVGCFVLTLNTLNIMYKIFIAPTEVMERDEYLSKTQISTLVLLLFIVIISGLFARDICVLCSQFFTFGNF